MKKRYNEGLSEYPKPILKFNSGIGATLCNECRVIIETGVPERPYKIFCDEHWRDYCNKTEECGWVCLECAAERGASPPPGHRYTVHTDICSLCNKTTSVTEPRDFGVQRGLLRIWK